MANTANINMIEVLERLPPNYRGNQICATTWDGNSKDDLQHRRLIVEEHFHGSRAWGENADYNGKALHASFSRLVLQIISLDPNRPKPFANISSRYLAMIIANSKAINKVVLEHQLIGTRFLSNEYILLEIGLTPISRLSTPTDVGTYSLRIWRSLNDNLIKPWHVRIENCRVPQSKDSNGRTILDESKKYDVIVEEKCLTDFEWMGIIDKVEACKTGFEMIAYRFKRNESNEILQKQKERKQVYY